MFTKKRCVVDKFLDFNFLIFLTKGKNCLHLFHLLRFQTLADGYLELDFVSLAVVNDVADTDNCQMKGNLVVVQQVYENVSCTTNCNLGKNNC